MSKEIRDIKANYEVRQEGDEKIIVGYAAVYNTLSNDLGGFVEEIVPGAFDDNLEDDVRYLFNHDPNHIFGRTTSGTLKLSVDEIGLRYEVRLPNTTAASDLYESIKRGDISQSSFAFTIDDEEWNERDGQYFRKINKVSRLFDVSSVTYPAYNEATTFALRSLEQFKEEQAKEVEKVEEPVNEVEEPKTFTNRNIAEKELLIINNK